MSVRGDEAASESLDASRHCLGHLLESFLVPATHDLSFREVVARCLYENWCDAQLRFDHLVACCNRVREELDGLMETHREATGATRRRAKKDMTFTAVTSRASRLTSPLWSPTSRRAPLKGTS